MDQDSFTRAVEQYRDMVFRLALHILGSPQDADDAVQEVFLRLFRQEKPLEGEHLRRWLLRVTVNYCKDVLKSPWRRRTAPLEESIPAPPLREPRQAALYQAVMSLPEPHRAVLYLYYYEELSTSEIAALLHIRLSAVTTRLNRARKKLKDKLGEDWQDE